MRRTIDRVECPRCHGEVALTRAQVEHRVATCGGCTTRLGLRVTSVGEGPHRAMPVLEARAILPGPPTARIREDRSGGAARLTVRQERGHPQFRDGFALVLGIPLALAAAIVGGPASSAGLTELAATRLWGREELAMEADDVVHRSLRGHVRRVPRAEIATVEIVDERVVIRGRGGDELRVVDPLLGHSRATLEWVVGWVREGLEPGTG